MSGAHGIRGAVRGFAALAAATIVGQVIGFVALAIVARRVGPSNLGDYAFAAVFTSYVLVITDLGLSVYGVREIARQPERTRDIAGQVLALRCVSFAIGAAAVVPLSSVLAPAPDAPQSAPLAQPHVPFAAENRTTSAGVPSNRA